MTTVNWEGIGCCWCLVATGQPLEPWVIDGKDGVTSIRVLVHVGRCAHAMRTAGTDARIAQLERITAAFTGIADTRDGLLADTPWSKP